MSDSESPLDRSTRDEMRLCPTCRSEISVWATKCRFCGVDVGRPRVEETRLSMKDLGGVRDREKFEVSGNVQDALKAFMEEETSVLETEREAEEAGRHASWFGRKPVKAAPRAHKTDDLPELEGYHKDLAESVGGPLSPRTAAARRRRPAQPALSTRLFTLGAVIAGLILLYVGSSFAVASIREYLEARNAVPAPDCPENRAEMMYTLGDPVLEVLEEAVAALRCNPSKENLELSIKYRALFEFEMKNELNKKDWNRRDLTRISLMVNQAAMADAHPDIQELRKRVQRDVAAYKIMLSKVSENEARATFILDAQYSGGASEVTAGVGEIVQGRFRIKSIDVDKVTLLDTDINGRQVVCRKVKMLAPN